MILFINPVLADTASPPLALTDIPSQLLIAETELDWRQARNSEAWQPFTATQLNQGISTRQYWLRFSLNNTDSTALRKILVSETSYLDQIELYQLDQNGELVASTVLSDRLPFSQRTLRYRTLATEISVPADTEQQFYLLHAILNRIRSLWVFACTLLKTSMP